MCATAFDVEDYISFLINRVHFLRAAAKSLSSLITHRLKCHFRFRLRALIFLFACLGSLFVCLRSRLLGCGEVLFLKICVH